MIRPMGEADISRVIPLYLDYYNGHEGACWTKEQGAAMVKLQAVNDEMHHHFYDRLGYGDVNNLPGYHSLAVKPQLVLRVESAFSDLEARGLLRHGSGRFDFGGFQTHL